MPIGSLVLHMVAIYKPEMNRFDINDHMTFILFNCKNSINFHKENNKTTFVDILQFYLFHKKIKTKYVKSAPF